MYSPVGQNPPGMLDQGVQKERKCCWKVLGWCFQIGTWATLIMSIALSGDNGSGIFAVFFIFYLAYMVIEFCSPTARYLCHKSSDQGMYQKMGRNFQTPPEICFHCECYHYVDVEYYTTDKDGNKHRHTRKEKRVTYTERYVVPYYSSRDVSGLFYLNCERAVIEKKRYIKLELKEEINFADAISYYDYERAKSHFWLRNRFRDTHFSFWETRTIPGMDHHNLIKLVDQEPCTVNMPFFVLFTFLTGAEIFSLYFDTLCVYQKFKVRKLVSTRYDLNQPVYQTFVPQLDLISNQYEYGAEYFNYLNQGYDLQLPSQEELEAARQYQNKIPDYQISSGGGGVQNGVIMDDPGYSSFNPNEAPAEFAAISGDVGIDRNQVNENGGPPPGYDQPGFQFNIAPPESGTDNNQGGGYSSSQQGYTPPPNP
jgi:hypothetical protein